MDELKISLGTESLMVDVARSRVATATLWEMERDVDVVHVPATGDSETVGQLYLGLMRGDFDMAVHRMYRIPRQQISGLIFAAILKRDDQHDALAARDGLTLEQLPKGSVIATRSNLRHSQLLNINPGLTSIKRTPGQLLEFLEKVCIGEIDGLVAGAADFEAVGRLDPVTRHLDSILPDTELGTTGLEYRSEDKELIDILRELDHPDTRVCVTTERAAYAAPDADGTASVVTKTKRDRVLSLTVAVPSKGDSRGLMMQMGMPTSGYHTVRAARRVAVYLRSKGAEELGRNQAQNETEPEAESSRRVTEFTKARILVPRKEGRIARELRGRGLDVTSVALQRREVLAVNSTLEGANWVAFTSVCTVESIRELGWRLLKEAKIAAVGVGTTDVLRETGHHVDLVPEGVAGVPAFLGTWPTDDRTGAVLMPGSTLLVPEFVSRLHVKGWRAQLILAYAMQLLRRTPTDIHEMWEEGAFDAVIVTPSSNVIVMGHFLGWHPKVLVFAVEDFAAKVLGRTGIKVVVTTENYPVTEVLRLFRKIVEG